MADDSVIEITGVDELISHLENSKDLATVLLMEAMNRSVDYVATDAAIPAPESKANQPPPPYYQRQVGTIYADGSTRGESQDIRNKWEKQIAIQDDGVIGTVANSATYAPWVHHPQKQIPIHAVREWRTTTRITENVRGKVIEFFGFASDRLAKFMNRS